MCVWERSHTQILAPHLPLQAETRIICSIIYLNVYVSYINAEKSSSVLIMIRIIQNLEYKDTFGHGCAGKWLKGNNTRLRT